MTTDDAPRGQHHVNGAAHGNAQTSQLPVVSCGLNHYIFPAENDQIQSGKKSTDLIELLVESTPLENLRKDQIANRDFLGIEKSFKQDSLGSWLASKVVDPDTRVDKNHLSRLIASRSPSHVILPRSFRISDCCFNRSSVFNPNSTTSRLVRKPVARSVSAMSLSSMTMLVRIVCIFQSYHTHHTTDAALAVQQRAQVTLLGSLFGRSPLAVGDLIAARRFSQSSKDGSPLSRSTSWW